MKKIIIALLAVLFLSTPAFAEMKIAYVNLQKALNDSAAGAQAKSEIAAQAKEYETEFKIKQDTFLKLKNELEKQGALLSDNAKAEKLKEYQTQIAALQKFQNDARRKLQQEDEKRTQAILKELSDILRKFGKDGDYSMIIEKSEGGLIYVDDDMIDLTVQLIEAYDASKKK
ncbi:MAG: OmpH family outer membrane protein [Deltaproteobacteria bacterium]|nr:MAG: OmpH family outer membrane protein [Deltaproteobacteria bacterium]RLB78643.1 MAG: OmpH family outer membrane protein [Deltaproteobacteria bacterium]